MINRTSDEWERKLRKTKRELESARFLKELLNAPTPKAKREIVAQYNPLHYVLTSGSQGGESVEVWDALHKEQIRRRGF
jgi:hypothetical protein